MKRKRKAAAAKEEKDDGGPEDLQNTISPASPMIRRSYHPSLVISAPAPIAYSASPHPENMAIPPWTDKASNGVNTPMRAVSTSLLRPGPPRELNVVFHILKWGSNGRLRSMASSGVELKVRGKQCVFAWG